MINTYSYDSQKGHTPTDRPNILTYHLPSPDPEMHRERVYQAGQKSLPSRHRQTKKPREWISTATHTKGDGSVNPSCTTAILYHTWDPPCLCQGITELAFLLRKQQHSSHSTPHNRKIPGAPTPISVRGRGRMGSRGRSAQTDGNQPAAACRSQTLLH